MSAKRDRHDHYCNMSDHDILVTLATKFEELEVKSTNIENHTCGINGTLAKHDIDIATIQATCAERSKTVFNYIRTLQGRKPLNIAKDIGLLSAVIVALIKVSQSL